jgi:hypothetical protein
MIPNNVPAMNDHGYTILLKHKFIVVCGQPYWATENATPLVERYTSGIERGIKEKNYYGTLLFCSTHTISLT